MVGRQVGDGPAGMWPAWLAHGGGGHLAATGPQRGAGGD